MQVASALHPYSRSTEVPLDVRWMQAATWALVFVLLGVLVGAGLSKLTNLPYFTLRQVQLEGDLGRNSTASVRASIVPRMDGGFFSVDLGKARGVFEAVPWVRKAVIRRVWPNELRVMLEEHRPAAYWHRDDREDQLVNTFGEVFDANLGDVEDEHLPTLEGPSKPEPDDAQKMLSMLRRLSPILQDLGDIDTLRLSDRGSWAVVLEQDATIELGRGAEAEILARANRFVQTFSQVKRRYASPLAYADLRYAEGYAVKLRGLTTLSGSAAANKPKSSSTR